VNEMGRVNGNLNLSRAIGDLKYKQLINLPPEVILAIVHIPINNIFLLTFFKQKETTNY
jgi:hypothetical protein